MDANPADGDLPRNDGARIEAKHTEEFTSTVESGAETGTKESRIDYDSVFSSRPSSDLNAQNDMFSAFPDIDKLDLLSSSPNSDSQHSANAQKEMGCASATSTHIQQDSMAEVNCSTEFLSPNEKDTFSKLVEDLDLLNSDGADHEDSAGKAVQLYMGPYGRIKSPFKKFSSFQSVSRVAKRSPRKLGYPKAKRLKLSDGSTTSTSEEEMDGSCDISTRDKSGLPSTSGLSTDKPTAKMSSNSSDQTDESSDEDKWEIIEESENELDEELDKKSNKFALSAVNVKSILHKIITNERVVEMVRQAVQEDPVEQEPGFEPKMTRSRVKEVLETKGNVPWGLSPVKKQPDSKFVDIDLPEEEEDDEEYCPDKASPDSDTEDSESVVSSSFFSDFGSPLPSTPSTPSVPAVSLTSKPKTPSQSDSETNQSFQSPMGPPTILSVPKSNQKSSLLGRKFREALERDSQRVSQDEDELIASRTRSKCPLTDQSILDIEANYMAPDITADMYDTECDDKDWQDFLTGFYKNDVAPVEDSVDLVADEEDPEYNFLEEETDDEYDMEDFRDDRAVKVSKKELNELMDELYEEDYGVSDPIDDTCKLSIKVEAEKIIDSSQAKKNSSHYKSLSNGISDYERRQIDDQMRKHVQLLAQTFVMAQNGIDEHRKVADVARMYLNELNTFRGQFKDVSRHSAYNACNLSSALSVLNNPIWSLPQEPVSEKVKNIVFRFDRQAMPRLSERQMDVMWYNPTFMYPDLLPHGGFFKVCQLKMDRARIKFTEAEDNLLAMGMEQFMHLRDGKEYICRYMLTCKTKKQVQGRIKNLSAKAAKDNAVKMWKQCKQLPVFPQYAPFFDPSMMVPACDQELELENLPQWCTVYKEADDEDESSPDGKQSLSAPVTPQGHAKSMESNEMSSSFPKVKRSRARRSVRKRLDLRGPFASRCDGVPSMTPNKPVTVCFLNKVTTTADRVGYSVNQSCMEQPCTTSIPSCALNTAGGGPTVIVINNMPSQGTASDNPNLTYGVEPAQQPLQGSIGNSEIAPEGAAVTMSQSSLGSSSILPIESSDSLLEVPAETQLSDILATAAVACKILPEEQSASNATMASMKADIDQGSGHQPLAQQPMAVDTMASQNGGFLQMLNDDKFMASAPTSLPPCTAFQESVSVAVTTEVGIGNAEHSNEQLRNVNVPAANVGCQPNMQTMVASAVETSSCVQPSGGLTVSSQPTTQVISLNLAVSESNQTLTPSVAVKPVAYNTTQDNSGVACGTPVSIQNVACQVSPALSTGILQTGTANQSPSSMQVTPTSSISSQRNSPKSALEIVASYAPYFISQSSSVRVYSAKQQEQERTPTKAMTRYVRLAPKGTPPSSEKPTGFVKLRSSPRKKQYQKQVKNILPKGFVVSTFDKSPTKRMASNLIEKAKKGKHSYSKTHDKYCKILPRPEKSVENVTTAVFNNGGNPSVKSLKPNEQLEAVKTRGKSVTNLASSKTVYECNINIDTASSNAHASGSGKQDRVKDGIEDDKIDGYDGDRDLTEDDDEEEDEDKDRDDYDDDKFDTESDFTQSEDGNETQEEVDSMEDSQEDDDNHIADLMQASTTLRFDPCRDDLGKARLGKKDRDRDTNIAMLAPDIIDTDPQRDFRDTAFAQAYLHKVKKVLKDDMDTFEQFLKILYNFNQADESPIKLYKELQALFTDYTDLMLDFAGFLLPEQAAECDCYPAFQEFSQARGFLRKLEIYFNKNPQQFQKVMKVFSRWYRKPGRKMDDLRDQVEPMLKGNKILLEDFSKFFPCEQPSNSLMDDFEEVNWEEVRDDAKDDSFEEVELPHGEEILGTKHCTCCCHDTGDDNYKKKKKHCYRCCLTVIDGELVYKINKSTIKRIQVSFGPPIKPGYISSEEVADASLEAEIKLEPDSGNESVEIVQESDWLLDTDGAEKENIEHYSEDHSLSEEAKTKNSKSGQKKGVKDSLKNSTFLQRISKLSRPSKKPARLSTMMKSPTEKTPPEYPKIVNDRASDCGATSNQIDVVNNISSSNNNNNNNNSANPKCGTSDVVDTCDGENVSSFVASADQLRNDKGVNKDAESPAATIQVDTDGNLTAADSEKRSLPDHQGRTSQSPYTGKNMETQSDTNSSPQHADDLLNKNVNDSSSKVNRLGISAATDSSEPSLDYDGHNKSVGVTVLSGNSTDSLSVPFAPLGSVFESKKTTPVDDSESRTSESSDFTFGPVVPKPCVADRVVSDILAPEGQTRLALSSGSSFFKVAKAAEAASDITKAEDIDAATVVQKKKDEKKDIRVVSPFSPFGQEIQSLTTCQSPLAAGSISSVCDQGKTITKSVRRITPIPVKEQSPSSFQTVVENSPMISENSLHCSPFQFERASTSDEMQKSTMSKPLDSNRTPTPIWHDGSSQKMSTSLKDGETSSNSQHSGSAQKSLSHSDSNTCPGITIAQPNLFSENANEGFMQSPGPKSHHISEESMFKCFEKPVEFGEHLNSVSNLSTILKELGGKSDSAGSLKDENKLHSHDFVEHQSENSLTQTIQNRITSVSPNNAGGNLCSVLVKDEIESNSNHSSENTNKDKSTSNQTGLNLLEEHNEKTADDLQSIRQNSQIVSGLSTIASIVQTSVSSTVIKPVDESTTICLFTPLRKVLDNGTVILTSDNHSDAHMVDSSVEVSEENRDGQQIIQQSSCKQREKEEEMVTGKSAFDIENKETSVNSDSQRIKKRKKSKCRHKHKKKSHCKHETECADVYSKQHGSGVESDSSARKSKHKSKHKSKCKRCSKESARLKGELKNPIVEHLANYAESGEASESYSDVVSESIGSGDVSRHSFSSQTDANEDEVNLSAREDPALLVKHEQSEENVSFQSLDEKEKEIYFKSNQNKNTLGSSELEINKNSHKNIGMDCPTNTEDGSQKLLESHTVIEETGNIVDKKEYQQEASDNVSYNKVIPVSTITQISMEHCEGSCSKAKKKLKHKEKDKEKRKRKKQKREKAKLHDTVPTESRKQELDKVAAEIHETEAMDIGSPVRNPNVGVKLEPVGSTKRHSAPGYSEQSNTTGTENTQGHVTKPIQAEPEAGLSEEFDSSEDSSTESMKEDEPSWSKDTDRIILEKCKTMGVKEKTFHRIARQLGHVTSKQVQKRFNQLIQFIYGSTSSSPASAATSQQ